MIRPAAIPLERPTGANPYKKMRTHSPMPEPPEGNRILKRCETQRTSAFKTYDPASVPTLAQLGVITVDET